jgi:hypothetical protein
MWKASVVSLSLLTGLSLLPSACAPPAGEHASAASVRSASAAAEAWKTIQGIDYLPAERDGGDHHARSLYLAMELSASGVPAFDELPALDVSEIQAACNTMRAGLRRERASDAPAKAQRLVYRTGVLVETLQKRGKVAPATAFDAGRCAASP